MTTNALKKQKGFTIIEVVLVLAIAGLIFLIVFLALPQLQKSRRDTQRRNDAGRIVAALESYAASNDGQYPASDSAADALYTSGELDGNLKDPTTGAVYDFEPNAAGNPSGTGKIKYASGYKCSGTSVVSGSARDIAIVIKLESGLYCRGNQ